MDGCVFCLDYFYLSFFRSLHVECLKEAPKKNAKAQT